MVLWLTVLQAYGQKPYRIVQFTGVVLTLDSATPLPGVHIMVPRAGRGTVSNRMGYFSMPVLTGDSIRFSSIAFKHHWFVVPDTASESIAYIVALHPDTIFLETVEIMPIPPEEVFKEMFLALRLPDQDLYNHMNHNLNEQMMARIYQGTPLGASGNYKAYMQGYLNTADYRYAPPGLQLLNPFAWNRLIKAIKNGDYKREKLDDTD